MTAAKYDAAVQHFGSAKEVLIRIAPQDGIDKSKIGDNVFALLKETHPDITLRRVEFVDELPKTVSGKLRRNELRKAVLDG